jgi:SET domain-containing protein
MKPIYPSALRIADTGTIKGRGVYAMQSFLKGELVEESPVLLVNTPVSDLPTELKTVLFNWGRLCKNDSKTHALALGYGSLFNHENPANLRYTPDQENQTMRFFAVREIAAGEELTINYNADGGGPEWADNNWFKRMGIAPLETE